MLQNTTLTICYLSRKPSQSLCPCICLIHKSLYEFSGIYLINSRELELILSYHSLSGIPLYSHSHPPSPQMHTYAWICCPVGIYIQTFPLWKEKLVQYKQLSSLTVQPLPLNVLFLDDHMPTTVFCYVQLVEWMGKQEVYLLLLNCHWETMEDVKRSESFSFI